MNAIVVNTGRIGPFILLSRITAVGDDGITATANPMGEGDYFIVEALAQCGAFHARYVTEFERHAFLLSVRKLDLLLDAPPEKQLSVSAIKTGGSDNAVHYAVSAAVANDDGSLPVASGDFTIALADYGGRFRKDILKPYYEKAFACLLKNLKTG